tara:strand:- start:431 stop:595 length:165 start_codon:yes stop_codon:yes gene_type:complete
LSRVAPGKPPGVALGAVCQGCPRLAPRGCPGELPLLGSSGGFAYIGCCGGVVSG